MPMRENEDGSRLVRKPRAFVESEAGMSVLSVSALGSRDRYHGNLHT